MPLKAGASIPLRQVGQNVGIKEVDEGIWIVTFMRYDLGFFDEQSGANAPRIRSVLKY
jgi:hypothetical protein